MNSTRIRQATVGMPLVQLDSVLPDDEVHVWYADFQPVQHRTNALHRLLDQYEQGRAARFKVAAARDQFVISRTFLRFVLGKYLLIAPRDVRFQVTAHGKPELAGTANISFNLSHTDGAAVLAVTRNRPVGVDVEQVRDNVEALELADRFFSPAEADWLRSQPSSQRSESFFACWTAKEAYIKACGTGLSMPLSGFTVIPKDGGKSQLKISGDLESSKNWSIWHLDLDPTLVCALAVQGMSIAVRLGTYAWPETTIE